MPRSSAKGSYLLPIGGDLSAARAYAESLHARAVKILARRSDVLGAIARYEQQAAPPAPPGQQLGLYVGSSALRAEAPSSKELRP